MREQPPINISLIVPVRNEEQTIRALLDGVLAQTRPVDEIVITDGGSTDSTPQIIEEYIEHGAPVRLVRARGPSLPGRGRNLAAAAASNEWLAFTDAGIRPNRDWLESLARQIENDATVDVVYGTYEPITDNLFKECAAIAYVPPPVETHGGWVRPRSIVSALMRREVWRAVGGFPEHLRSAEDLLFMSRVEEAGYHVVRAPAAIVNWALQPNIRRTFKKFVTYSRHNMRAGLWKDWQAVIFKRYALILLTALPALFFDWRWLFVTFALWLSFLTLRALAALQRNRRSYPASGLRNTQRLAMLVPLIATLDAATIVGTIKWLVRDKLLRLRGVGDVT